MMKQLCKICKVRELEGNTWHCGACWMSGKVETRVTDCGKYVYAIEPDPEPTAADLSVNWPTEAGFMPSEGEA